MFNHTVPADFSTLRFFAFLPIGKLSVTENQCQSVSVRVIEEHVLKGAHTHIYIHILVAMNFNTTPLADEFLQK